MKNNLSKLNINGITAIASSLITALVYFLVYRNILQNLGESLLGHWAILLGFTSIISQSASSIGTNIIREVANNVDTHNNSNKNSISKLLVNGVFAYFVLFIILSFLVVLLLKVLFPADFHIYKELLPHILLSIFLNLISLIFFSIIDGLMLSYIKNILNILSTLILLTLSFLLVSKYQLKGLSIALIAQNLFLFILAFVYVLKKIRLSFSINYLNRESIKKVFTDSWELQSISLMVLTYEPVTKYFLRKAGLNYVGYFEISNRIISQIRNIFVSVNQTFLSTYVLINKESKTKFKEFSSSVFKNNFKFSVLCFYFLIFFFPFFSIFFYKGFQPIFFYSFCILLFPYLLNIVSTPNYFLLFAFKEYSYPFYSHLIIALLNIILCSIGYYFWGGIGVVIGWGVAILFGSGILIYYTQKLAITQLKFSFIPLSKHHIDLVLLFLIPFLVLQFEKGVINIYIYALLFSIYAIYSSTFLYRFIKHKLFKKQYSST